MNSIKQIFCDGCTTCTVNQCEGIDREECSWMIKVDEAVKEYAEEIQSVVDVLEAYTNGKLNTSNVKISVLQMRRLIYRLERIAEKMKET